LPSRNTKEKLDTKDGTIASLKEQLAAKDGTIASLKETYENRLGHLKEQIDFLRDQLGDAKKKSDKLEAYVEKLESELEHAKSGGQPNWPAVNNLVLNIGQQADEVRAANTAAASTAENLSGMFADYSFVNDAFATPDDASTSVVPSEQKKKKPRR